MRDERAEQEPAVPMMLRPTKIAAVCDVSRAKVYQEIKSGALASIRVGGQIRVTYQAFQDWLAAQQVERG